MEESATRESGILRYLIYMIKDRSWHGCHSSDLGSPKRRRLLNFSSNLSLHLTGHSEDLTF
jgi:hypothetical protein